MAWANMSNKKDGKTVKRRNHKPSEMVDILICAGEKMSC